MLSPGYFPAMSYLNARSSTPTPGVSVFAARNSDHGRSKTQTKTQTTPDSVFIGGKEKLRTMVLSFWNGKNSDHGLSLGCFWGVGVDGGAFNTGQLAK